MKQSDNVRAHKPEGLETKKAHIVGGGIAGLAAAVLLIDDGYMDGKNVTIYEKLYITSQFMPRKIADRPVMPLYEAQLRGIPSLIV